jgi:predicted flap endonuclease-1-like 5' DNA nuclease
MFLQYILLISTQCLWDLATALLFTLIPAILAWLGSRAVFQKKADEMQGRNEETLNEARFNISRLSGELNGLNGQLAEARTDAESKNLRISHLYSQIEEQSKLAEDWQAKIKEWETREITWQNDKNQLNETINRHEQELKNWSLRGSTWDTERNALTAGLEAKEADLAKWSLRLSDWENEKNQLSSSVASRDADLGNWTFRFNEAEQEKTALKSALANKEEELAQWNIRLNQWEQERIGYATAIAGKDREIGDWNYRFGQWEQERNGYATTLTAKEATLAEWTARLSTIEQERDRLFAESSDRLAQADHWRDQYAALHAQYDALQLRLGELESARTDAARSLVLAGKIYRWDDLKIVEGIGPKIEGILQENDIRTWVQLSDTPVERLREIMAGAGERYKLADPTNWAEQARLAHTEDAEGLAKLQAELTGGREITKPAAPRKKTVRVDADLAARLNKLEAEERAQERRLLKQRQQQAEKGSLKFLGRGFELDDHEVVEGIGPKIDEVLRAAGIETWLQLSETTVERLRDILDAAGPQYRIADPTTWPQQAGLAHANQWEELAALQTVLTAGRE